MGGNRRSRGGNASQNRQQNRNEDSTKSSQQHPVGSSAASRDPYERNDVILAEIARGLNVSWRDIGVGCLALLGLITFGAFLGVFASMTLSVHYYEKSAFGSHIGVSAAKRNFGLTPTYSGITSFDDATLLANKLMNGASNPNYQNVGRVLPAKTVGTVDALMLVEESTPLGIKMTFSDRTSGAAACSRDDSSDSCPENQEQEDGSSPKLSTAQAKRFVAQYEEWLRVQPKVQPPDPMIQPTKCQDGSSGFDDWRTLKQAMHEANSIGEERLALWSSYFATDGRHLSVYENDLLYYEEDVIFRICPGETLTARRGPVTVNAPNLVLECQDCTVDVGGTHLAFGPRARNVLVRGITFTGATSSSLTFFHHGSDAIFEDCTWIGNTGRSQKFGAVADLNSTSAVNFYRCSIGHGNKKNWFGSPTSNGGSSSLSIRA
ncbi:unnamed protein product [Cylindrotheca closterium]|uniref:Uncharacterized protein n=1 Tax=Cylindrotheca closterium TaxID=2856 RepID=A0AAD2CGS1_9STRA|nr:unnamed protein product [Cylindrotheca closterium]